MAVRSDEQRHDEPVLALGAADQLLRPELLVPSRHRVSRHWMPCGLLDAGDVRHLRVQHERHDLDLDDGHDCRPDTLLDDVLPVRVDRGSDGAGPVLAAVRLLRSSSSAIWELLLPTDAAADLRWTAHPVQLRLYHDDDDGHD